MRVLRIVLYTVGAAGMLRLHRSLTAGGGTPTSRAVAAIAYVANPYAVVGGSTLAVLLPYALLPWQSLFVVRALRSSRPGPDVAAFALTFAAMSGMNAGVVPLLQLLTLPFLVWWVRVQDGVAWRHSVRVLVRCAVAAVLVSLYWLVPSVVGSGQGVAVADPDGLDPQGVGAEHQLVRMRGAPQEREVGGRLQLGVAGHPNTPCSHHLAGSLGS